MAKTQRHLLAVLGALALMLAGPFGNARAEPLVADLDSHLVAITTGFTGTDVLLFGAIKDEGEIIVVVHGPKEEVTVRRKERIAGIWANRDSVVFKGVPSFYFVAASSGAELELPLSARERHQIGVENIRMQAPTDVPLNMVDVFRQALIRSKQKIHHYNVGVGEVEKRGDHLFRTTVHFPADIPIGTYTVETLLVRDGQVQSAQTTPLFISKVGLGAHIYRLAHTQSALFGIAAVLIAAIAGFTANWLFRRN